MRAVALAVSLSLLSAPLFARQAGPSTLADTAEKEKQRRAAAKPAKKTFSNDDLGGGAGIMGSTPDSSPTETGAKKEGDKPEKTDLEIKAEKRADYEKQIAEERRMMGVIQKAKEDAERELGDFANLTFGTRRQSVAQLVEDAEKELAARQQKIADLEEQARREGVRLSQ